MKKADHWMPLYIGDYLADTSRLTTEQHGAYFLLLMDYWRNGPPPDDDEALASITKLSVDRWRKHKSRLAGFFAIEDGRWVQGRADAERQKANGISETRSGAGKEGAAARWKDHMPNSKPMANATAGPLANGQQTDAPSPRHSPSLRSGEPRQRAEPPPARPDDVTEQVWKDWLALRRRKRADVTETVLTEARREAGKALMTFDRFLAVWCVRGSQGLQAEWLKPDERNSGETPFQRNARLRVEEMSGGLVSTPAPGGGKPSPLLEMIHESPFAIGRR